MGIVCKQTMRYCFNFFNENLLVPRSPNLHKNKPTAKKITFYTVAKSHKLFICEEHFTVDQIYVCSSPKLLKEGALPTLNLSRLSANANATNSRSKRAIEKREKYALLQE